MQFNNQQIVNRISAAASLTYRIARIGALTLLVFYFSLIVSSNPVNPHQAEQITRAIDLLETKGFEREALLLRRVTLFRNTDNWINSFAEKENSFAATNCPFGIITIYPDFYFRTKDDTERAMVLLHEAQHLQGASEGEAYRYVWQNRRKLGWIATPYGTTESYTSIEIITREFAPELFNCPENLWSDCTEILRARK